MPHCIDHVNLLLQSECASACGEALKSTPASCLLIIENISLRTLAVLAQGKDLMDVTPVAVC
jgi:hypothetical protein